MSATLQAAKESSLRIARNCQNIVEVGWKGDIDGCIYVWLNAKDALELAKGWRAVEKTLQS